MGRIVARLQLRDVNRNDLPRMVPVGLNLNLKLAVFQLRQVVQFQPQGIDLLLDAAQKMQQASLHRMPVLRNKKAVGVISSSDIIAAFLKAQPHSRTADASAWRADCKATS